MANFVPDDWELTPKLRQYARDKRLTDATIDDQEEAFRIHQFKINIKCWDRCWMRWIRSAIEFGKVQPIQEHKHNMPEEISTSERERDSIKAIAQMNEYRDRMKK